MEVNGPMPCSCTMPGSSKRGTARKPSCPSCLLDTHTDQDSRFGHIGEDMHGRGRREPGKSCYSPSHFLEMLARVFITPKQKWQVHIKSWWSVPHTTLHAPNLHALLCRAVHGWQQFLQPHMRTDFAGHAPKTAPTGATLTEKANVQDNCPHQIRCGL